MFNEDKMSLWTRVRCCWAIVTKGSVNLEPYRSRRAQKAWDICEQRRKDLEVNSRPRTDCPDSEFGDQ